jgi:hypothetical protein
MNKQIRVVFCASFLLAAPALFAVNNGGAMSLIPRDAVSVGVVHIADMRSSPLSGMLFKNTDKVSANGDAERFLLDAGLKPSKDIDTLVVAVSPRTTLGSEGKVLVAAEGRFNVDRLTGALVTRGAKVKSSANGRYYLIPDSHTGESGEPAAVAFADAHLALAGSESSVVQALADRASGGTGFAAAGSLGRELARIDPSATAFALVDMTRAARLTNAGHVDGRSATAQQLSSALKNVSTIAIWATDTGDALKLNAFGVASDAETLQLLEDTLRGGLAAMRLAVQDKQPDMVGVLRRFDVRRTNDTVSISGTVPAESLKKFAR